MSLLFSWFAMKRQFNLYNLIFQKVSIISFCISFFLFNGGAVSGITSSTQKFEEGNSDHLGKKILTAAGVYLRKAPSLDAKRIVMIHFGDIVFLIGISPENENWFHVETQGHISGWIKAEFLTDFNEKDELDLYYRISKHKIDTSQSFGDIVDVSNFLEMNIDKSIGTSYENTFKSIYLISLRKSLSLIPKDKHSEPPYKEWIYKHQHEPHWNTVYQSQSESESVHKETNETLISAAFKGDLNVVRSLLNKGEDVNRKNEYGTTALQQAVVMNHKQIVSLLIEKGADVNTKDNEGNTILIHAAWSSSRDIIRLLLEKGADVYAKNNKGSTALVHAVSGGNKDAIKIISQAQQDKTITNLASDDAKIRYFAILDLSSMRILPESVLNMLIDYLDDLRGRYPGNTVAGAAAELLARHPQQAKLAIPELMKLLAYTEKYAMPSGSAAETIRAVKRVDLEAYLANLDKKKKLELSKSLLPVLENGIGSLPGLATISTILGMLGEDVAIPALESTLADAKKQEVRNPFAKDIRIRADAALKILKGRWKIGDASYLKEMKAADALLGKPDQYVSAVDLFPQALKIISIKMKGSGAKAAYIVRKNKIPFDSVSNGIPMARLAVKGKWFYLYTCPYMELRIPCRTRMVVLTSVSKSAYADDYLSDGGMQPSYFPKTSDYAFIEMGANGPRLLDNALKSLQIKEGFTQDTWYEFWPEEWWDGAAKSLGRPLKRGEKLVWVKVVDGEIVGYAHEEVD